MKIFDSTSLKEISRIDLGLPDHPAPRGQPTPFVVDMTGAGDKVAVLITYLPTYRSGKLRIYELNTNQMTWEWSFDEDVNGYSLAFSADTTKIAVAIPQARRGSQLVVFDIVKNSVAMRLNDKGDTPSRAVFASNSELLTVSAWQFRDLRHGSIKLWDINTGKLIREITASPSGIHSSVDISKDGRYLLGYVGSAKKNEYFIDSFDQRFWIWELPSEKVVVTSPVIAPNNDEPELKISPSGNMVVVYRPTAGFAEIFQIRNIPE